MTGVVVVAGNEIMGADIFGDRLLFEKLWDKLLKSYVLDALTEDEVTEKKVTVKDVEEFLDKFGKAEQTKDDTAVAGTRIEFESKEIVGGMVFNNEGDLIHYVQFPYVEVENTYYNNQNENVNLPVQIQINAPPEQYDNQEVDINQEEK